MRGDVSMRTRINKLPNHHSIVIDITPRNVITVVVKKGEDEVTVVDHERFDSMVSTRIENNGEKLTLYIEYKTPALDIGDSCYASWGTMELNFETSEVNIY